jgi:hypothetical protein
VRGLEAYKVRTCSGEKTILAGENNRRADWIKPKGMDNRERRMGGVRIAGFDMCPLKTVFW